MAQNMDIETNLPTEAADRGTAVVVHQSEVNSAELNLLEQLIGALGVVLFDVRDTERQAGGIQKLEKVQKYLNDYDKAIIAFPGTFQDAQLVQAVNMIMKRQRKFVAVITYAEQYEELPSEIQEFNIRRVLVDRHCTDDMINELKAFINDDATKLNLAMMNFGNGLAWSYYFGYLSPMLPDLEEIIMDSKWRKGDGKDVSQDNISKKMLIYPKLEIFKRDLKGGRLTFIRNEKRVTRAGIDRVYEIDIRQVKSADGSEAYYGIADYANCLRLLLTLCDGGLPGFDMTEDDMNKHGRYFSERLKLFLEGGCMAKYNEKMGIDSSKFQLIGYNEKEEYSVRAAAEDELVEDLFQRMKATCQGPPATSGDSTEERDLTVICLPLSGEDVMLFTESLRADYAIVDMSSRTPVYSRRVFMVITDEMVRARAFEDLFYRDILVQGHKRNNRRYLVVLDCLSEENRSKQPALELLHLFKRVRHEDPDWRTKVKQELEGDLQEITYDLMFHNIGTGFALSYYNGFLKFRIPPMRHIVRGTAFLKKKFDERLMSTKLFILHPQSCKTREKVSDLAPGRIVDKADDPDLQSLKFEDVEHDRRQYHPKASSITDADGKKYIMFVEFNTQAETLRRMMDEGFLDESLLAQEWERFKNKLKILIQHRQEPMGLKDRLRIIQYDDTKVTDVAGLILERVKEEIKAENGIIGE